jgi:hypothetical protein
MSRIFGLDPDNIEKTFRVNEFGQLIADVSSAAGVTDANTPEISSNPTALEANVVRRGAQIQNVGTNPLFILFGTGASSSVFHAVLKGGQANSDGLGGSISMLDGSAYKGEITVAGTAPKYVVTEF